MPDRTARRFRPGVAATVATGLALTILIALGAWQLQRMEWKRALTAHIERQLAEPPRPLEKAPDDPAELDWRRVRMQAVLLHEHSFAWGTAAIAGEVGARLVAPARLPDGSLVLVDLGFVAQSRLPPSLPQDMRSAGPVTIEGVARSLANWQPGWFTPEDQPEMRRFWRLDPAALERFVGERLVPLLIIAERAEPAAILGRTAAVRVDLRDPHLGYALTWFGLAAVLAVIYVLFGFARGRSAPEVS